MMNIIISILIATASLLAPAAFAAPAPDPAEAARATRAFMASAPSDRSARDAFDRVCVADPHVFTAILHAAIENEDVFRALDPRTHVYPELHRLAFDHAAWDPAGYAEVRDRISADLSVLLERWNQGNKHLQMIVEMKLAMNAFTTDDLPFLMRTYLRHYTGTLAEPFLRLMPEASLAARADFLDRLDLTEQPAPHLAHALAYHLGWSDDPLVLSRIIRTLPGDASGVDLGSARRTYRRARERGDEAAERFRAAANAVLGNVLTTLHRRLAAGESDAIAALKKARFPTGARRTPALAHAIDLAITALNTGERLDDFADVAKQCDEHFR